MKKKPTIFESDVVLGERYRDSISGFEGVATATVFYLHACERVSLEAWLAEQGEFRELTFDAPRLVHVDSEQAMTTTKTGGSRPSPPKRSVNH